MGDKKVLVTGSINLIDKIGDLGRKIWTQARRNSRLAKKLDEMVKRDLDVDIDLYGTEQNIGATSQKLNSSLDDLKKNFEHLDTLDEGDLVQGGVGADYIRAEDMVGEIETLRNFLANLINIEKEAIKELNADIASEQAGAQSVPPMERREIK